MLLEDVTIIHSLHCRAENELKSDTHQALFSKLDI
jgi:hypothetical protein